MQFTRKMARLVAAFLLVSTMMTPALALTGTVNSESSVLNMRDAAGAQGNILNKLAHGTVVEVLEQQDGWFKIVYQGEVGYVSGAYLKVEGMEAIPAAPVPMAEAPVEAEPVYVRVINGPLNIRSGPGTDYDKVGQLNVGKVVEIQGLQDGWYQIEAGYISAEYVKETTPSDATLGQTIADYALQFVGCRYVYGGSSPNGFDCSGLTSYVYKQFGYSLNRTASGQMDNGVPVAKEDLQPGDLVMFNEGNRNKRATHVGMYIGNGQIVHASTASVGVVVSDLYSNYYVRTYVGARRIV